MLSFRTKVLKTIRSEATVVRFEGYEADEKTLLRDANKWH
jgi:hypothetical protein